MKGMREEQSVVHIRIECAQTVELEIVAVGSYFYAREHVVPSSATLLFNLFVGFVAKFAEVELGLFETDEL